MTLNAVVNKLLKPLADDHLQLNDFGFGDLYNHATSTQVKYPLLWVSFSGLRYSNKAFNYTFSLVFADICKDDLSNVLEIQSDMILIGADFAAKLTAIDNDLIEINNDFTFKPFSERFTDLCAGVVMDFTIKSLKVLSDCEFPSIFGLTQARLLTQSGLPIVQEDGGFITP
ncbi:MAG: hypothetical protein ABIN67_13810 [Ferruginibacter sp.]